MSKAYEEDHPGEQYNCCGLHDSRSPFRGASKPPDQFLVFSRLPAEQQLAVGDLQRVTELGDVFALRGTDVGQLLAEPAHQRAGCRLGIGVITSVCGHAWGTRPSEGVDLGSQLGVAVGGSRWAPGCGGNASISSRRPHSQTLSWVIGSPNR